MGIPLILESTCTPECTIYEWTVSFFFEDGIPADADGNGKNNITINFIFYFLEISVTIRKVLNPDSIGGTGNF